MGTRLDRKVEISENKDARTSWISEMNASKFDSAVHSVQYSAVGRLRIDLRAIIEEFNDLGTSNMRL